MARKRMVDPTIWADEDFGSMKYEGQVFYIGMISNADDEGRLPGNANFLTSVIFPFKAFSDKESVDLRDYVLSNMKSVILYTVNAKEYIQFKNWRLYQSINKPTTSKYPPLPDDYRSATVGLPPNRIEENRIEKNRINDPADRRRKILDEENEEQNAKRNKAAKLALMSIFSLFLFALPVSAHEVRVRYTIKPAAGSSSGCQTTSQTQSTDAHGAGGVKVNKGLPATKPTPTALNLAPVAPKKAPVYPKTYTPQSEIERKICDVFGSDCPMAIAICKAESGCRENAIGDGSLTFTRDGIEYGKSYGVFQIRHLPGRPSPDQLLTAEVNIRHAYGMFKTQGWNPWSVYKSGRYLSFL